MVMYCSYGSNYFFYTNKNTNLVYLYTYNVLIFILRTRIENERTRTVYSSSTEEIYLQNKEMLRTFLIYMCL